MLALIQPKSRVLGKPGVSSPLILHTKEHMETNLKGMKCTDLLSSCNASKDHQKPVQSHHDRYMEHGVVSYCYQLKAIFISYTHIKHRLHIGYNLLLSLLLLSVFCRVGADNIFEQK